MSHEEESRLTYDTEVLLQAMADEDAPEIHKEPQLLICDLQRHERMSRKTWIEITDFHFSPSVTVDGIEVNRRTFDSRILRQVVHDRLARMDMVVDERDAHLLPIVCSQYGYAAQAQTCRSENLLCAVRAIL